MIQLDFEMFKNYALGYVLYLESYYGRQFNWEYINIGRWF